MIVLDENKVRHLSFADFDVVEIEFSSPNKVLKIFIEGAWLDIGGGSQLGQGGLFFNSWDSFTMKRFDPHTETWSKISEEEFEPLKDICEIKFDDSYVFLYGFGKNIGYWMEWKLYGAKMHAEFDR